jgi:hypothetical protein
MGIIIDVAMMAAVMNAVVTLVAVGLAALDNQRRLR